MLRGWMALLAVVAAQPGSLLAQCVSTLFPPNSGYASIGFKSTSIQISSSQITTGVSYWSTACGNDGVGYPALRANQTGTMTISVRLQVGTSTTTSGGCGMFVPTFNASHQVTGGAIVVFDADVLGQDCEPRRSDTIAHEIGQVQGLGDSTSSGYMMSGSSTRQVRADECSTARDEWWTPQEQYQEDLTRCEMNCPYACEGNPPVCNTTVDTGGGYQCPFSQCSPLVLDLNGDGIHTTGLDDTVSFDLTGDGIAERLAWTDPTTDEAFLWIDLDRNGRVDDGRELFGHGTILESGSRAKDGFEALAQHDQPSLGGNSDGRISSEDRVWRQLRLWVDSNHDGVCVPAESGPIAEYGVLEIPLSYSVHEEADESGNVHRLRGSYIRVVRGKGGLRVKSFILHDVFFQALPYMLAPARRVIGGR